MYSASKEGPDLTPEQRRDLDDDFYTSDPVAYWRSRIDRLLAEPVPLDHTAGLTADVLKLGLDPRILSSTEPATDDRDISRRLDAFALRQHIAESLVRLVRAVLENFGQPDACLWAALSDDRATNRQVCDAVLARGEAKAPLPLGPLLLTAAEIPKDEASVPPKVRTAVEAAWAWILRAIDLIYGDGLDTNAANNKFKHGLAVRVTDQNRIVFTRQGPNEQGNLPLSTFTGAIVIVDDVAAETLTRQHGKHSPHPGAWEVSQFNLRTPQIIAECLMLTLVYGAVFAAAADRHFAGRDYLGPAHPGLALGPHPNRLAKGAAGIRMPITTDDAGATPPLIIADGRQAYVLRQTGQVQKGVVVEDDSPDS
ncbi:hypothetical protein CTKZ_17440 [Cellulomonas algicola]|uniref:Uncharacterized protein n=1 Tax=Cellulomonas algicola TaxID=2071633 RepID=A0A401UZU6_9CELL|nr:hypothetical protein [Cellulomonas algicola]GCD20182.1 hypothetical protein CTKZ_17440 [Cellulomonas algicola]